MLQNGLESDVARFTTHVQTCQQPDLVQDRFACMHVFLLPVFKYLKGTFHSNQNARFEFSATFTGEWNSIIQNFPKEDNLARHTQILETFVLQFPRFRKFWLNAGKRSKDNISPLFMPWTN